MATVNKTNTGKYRARWRTPDGKQHQRTFTTEGQAKIHAARMEIHTNDNHTDHNLATIPFHTHAHQWLQTKRRITPSTRIRYTAQLNNVNRHIGDLPIGTITRHHIDQLVDQLAERHAVRTVVKTIAGVVSPVFKRAVRDRVILSNPCDHVELPALPNDEMLWVTPDEVGRLAAACKRHGSLVEVAAYTGLRWGEITALTVGDVDLDAGVLRVCRSAHSTSRRVGPVKSDRSRRQVPITSVIAGTVERLCAEAAGRRWVDVAGVRLDGVLWTQRDGGPLWHANFRQEVWGPAKVAAGVDVGLRFHGLRHSACTWLILAGVDIVTVSRWMGHASANVTLGTYGHLYPARLGDAAEALAGLRLDGDRRTR